jgi:hypothetical protein
MPIDAAELHQTLIWLDNYYASPDGLARPDGLSVNGAPDFEAIAAWVLDVFANSRLAGLDVDASRRNVMHAVQQTPEWRQRHANDAAALEVHQQPFAPTVGIDRREFLAVLHRLHVFYKSWNGLQRPHGMSLAGRPDFEAVAQWVFGFYLNDRMANRSPEEAWDRIVAEIKLSNEWQARRRDAVDATTLANKHLAGYQGFDLWPDTRELFDSELHDTAMTLRRGGRARLYSAYSARTIRRHFDWMADVGIDGVSIGRFLNGTGNPVTRQRLDQMLRLVRDGCAASGRTFFIWYDVSSITGATFIDDLRRDWAHIVSQVGVTSASRYLKHKGRPLVGIWGAGANTCDATPAQWIEIINSFKNEPHLRSTVLIGCSRDWRTNPQWSPVLAAADVVAPWTVSGWRTVQEADNYRHDVLEGDLALVKSRNQDYMPVVWPGLSTRQLSNKVDLIDLYPRQNGNLYWRQVFNAVEAGANCLFTAMFDEVDEGTAIFKTSESQDDVPLEGEWLTLDAGGQKLPSDWYLRLAGAATQMLTGKLAKTAAIPIQP